MKRVNLFYFLLLTIALFGCVTTSQKIMSENEKLQIRDEYKSCVLSNIEQLDDKSSDAYTVASAVSNICDIQYRRFLTTFVDGESSSVKANFYKDMLAERVEKIVPFVLKLRSTGKK